MRVLLVTGKGGVGKTTVAAATALRAAELGYRTLVTSTDPAHSLADAYDGHLEDAPLEIAPGLFGQQIDAQRRLESYWDVRERITAAVKEARDAHGIEIPFPQLDVHVPASGAMLKAA